MPTKIQGLEGNIFNDKELGIGLSIGAEADFIRAAIDTGYKRLLKEQDKK